MNRVEIGSIEIPLLRYGSFDILFRQSCGNSLDFFHDLFPQSRIFNSFLQNFPGKLLPDIRAGNTEPVFSGKVGTVHESDDNYCKKQCHHPCDSAAPCTKD
ncbi:MAG TPA: hypothetical protein DDZ11_02495, partial [Lentisphaeria bacterium]|nr:hypothetical protein [Lentisphaeria bacterium]